MNTITINYKITNERIVKAVAEGKSLKREQQVEVDLDSLSEENRKNLSMILRVDIKNSFYIVNDIEQEGIQGILHLANQIAAKGKTNYEFTRTKYIKEAEDFLSGNTRYIFATGIYKDGSGNFDLDNLKSKIDYLKKEYNISLDETKIIELAKSIQADVDIEREEKRIQREKEKAEADEKAKLLKEKANSAKLLLREWASENGSELLRLRLKHEQNWLSIAETEWAIANSVGFEKWNGEDSVEDYPVKNATIEQLLELEKAQAENPDHEIDILRCKFLLNDEECNYGESNPVYYKTFLRAYVKVPTGTEILFREIVDVSEE